MTEAQSSNAAGDASLWLAMAIAWSAFSLLAWVSAWLFGATTITSSWATTMGLLIVAVSVQLRWPILSLASRAADSVRHSVWLLGWTASINWLGYIAARSGSFQAAVPAMALIVAGEWWMLRRVPAGRLAWLGQLQNLLFARFAEYSPWSPEQIPPANSAHRAEVGSLSNPQACEDASSGDREDVFSGDESVRRRSSDGLDENGRRFLSGEVFVCLQPLQQTETLVIGFCPAFVGAPEVDLECESDEVTSRITHCTAAGMRISLRRPRSADGIEFLLSWYAIQTEPAPGLAGQVSSRLP